jgi:hypothetical protein
MRDGASPGRVEDTGDDVAGVELIRSHPIGDRDGRGDEHRVGYIAEPTVEESPEEAREREDIVDLVGEVAAPRGDDGGMLLRLQGVDLRHWICKAEDDRLVGHADDVFAGQQIGGGDADEYVGPRQNIAKGAGSLVDISVGHQPVSHGAVIGPSLMDDAPSLSQPMIFVAPCW